MKAVTLPLVTLMSPLTKPLTAWAKVKRKTGLVLMPVAAGCGATVSATSAGLNVTPCASAVELFPARSWPASAATVSVTTPAVVGVTSWLKLLALSVERAPRVPLVTVILLASTMVTASLKVRVKLIGLVDTLPELGSTATLGAVVSTVSVTAADTALTLPAASVAVAVNE